ncbi:hypothetical protein FHW77_005446, partial [Agrobacterium sp. RC10-4-1]|nr:hypothetical protein [Agrobacterium sp. RC10-4-1]
LRTTPRRYRPEYSNPKPLERTQNWIKLGGKVKSSETIDWPSGLTKAEADRAVRYALWEMNGFPAWLVSLSKAFPEIVHDRFAGEIEWEVTTSNTEVDPNYLLSDLLWHGHDLQISLSRTIIAILNRQLPKNYRSLENALLIIIRDEMITDEEISTFCSNVMTKTPDVKTKSFLVALLVSVDPDQGIDRLLGVLRDLGDKALRTEFCMNFAVQLLGGRRSSGKFRENYKNARHLRQLYFVLHENIKRKDDIERAGKGVYSPGIRDDAQDARNTVFKLLSEIPGKETYLALKEIAENYPEIEARAWMMTHAVGRAIQDSDLSAWQPNDVKDFSREAEVLPSDHRQLFELACSRLLDLKDDLENGDTSIADILVNATKETQLRNFVGGWLRDRAQGRYVIPQEDELADAKRPDLRFLTTGFDGPVPTEVKIADRWSGPKLFERIENQLCNDYLRDKRSSNGIFMLLWNGKQASWANPKNGDTLDFSELCQALQDHAQALIVSRADIEAVKVIGIDLVVRSTPKRAQR